MLVLDLCSKYKRPFGRFFYKKIPFLRYGSKREFLFVLYTNFASASLFKNPSSIALSKEFKPSLVSSEF